MHYLQSMIKFHQEIMHQEQSQSIYMSQYNNNNTNDKGQNYDRESEEGSTTYTPSSREERENDLLMITKLTRLKKVGV